MATRAVGEKGAGLGLGIPTIGGRGRYGGGRRWIKRRDRRYGNARVPSNLRPIPRYVGGGARINNLSPTLVLCNARSINNKTKTLQDFLAEQAVDLACVTETWVRDGETVALSQLAPPGFAVLHQSRTRGRGGGGIAGP